MALADPCLADVAELADALASGASGGNPVEVQILSSALSFGASQLAPLAPEASAALQVSS